MHLRDGSAKTVVRAATLQQKLQNKLSVLQYTDTGPTNPALTLECQAPGRVATGVPVVKSLG